MAHSESSPDDVSSRRLRDHLERAMANAENDETMYHLRQALQRLELESDQDRNQDR